MKTLYRRIISGIMFGIFLTNLFATQAFASSDNSYNEAELVESILEDLENGLATETIEEIDISSITQENLELEDDPALKDFISSLNSSIEPYDVGAEAVRGKLYSDTITEANGNKLQYFLTPRITLNYGDIPHSGDLLWSTKLEVISSIYLNGKELDPGIYMNRIKLKNACGYLLLGSNNAVFREAFNIEYKIINPPSVSVDLLSLIGIATAPIDSYLSSVFSLLDTVDIDYNSMTSNEVVNAIDGSNTNILSVSFDSDVILQDDGDYIKFISNAATRDSELEQAVTIPCGTRWEYDIYVGSKRQPSELDFELEVRENF